VPIAAAALRSSKIAPRATLKVYPGAYAEHPGSQTVIKVKRKVFLFVNGAIAPEDGVSLSVKLPHSGADVLELPLAEPMGYGMGKHGWVPTAATIKCAAAGVRSFRPVSRWCCSQLALIVMPRTMVLPAPSQGV